MAEDIIIWGSTDNEHDDRLNALFPGLSSKGLTVNPAKCLYKQGSLWFYRYTLTSQGLQAVRKKIFITQPSRCNKTQKYPCSWNYCARFIRNFATLTAPLWDFTKKGVTYEWTQTQQQAFEQVKDAIMADCLMAYYTTRTSRPPSLLMRVLMVSRPFCQTSRMMFQRGMLPTPVALSQSSSRSILTRKRKHWQWFGGVNVFTCISLAPSLTCSLTTKPACRHWALGGLTPTVWFQSEIPQGLR